jgi:hypothetical protein
MSSEGSIIQPVRDAVFLMRYCLNSRSPWALAECFYNKDGKWYYAGVYLGFRMKDLTSEEWAALSNEVSIFPCRWHALPMYVHADNASNYQGNIGRSQKRLSAEFVRDNSALRCRRVESGVCWPEVYRVQQRAV